MKLIKSIFVAIFGILAAVQPCLGQADADLTAFWDFESGRTGTDVWSTHLHGTATTPNAYDTVGGIAFIDGKNQFFTALFGEPTLSVRTAADDGIPAFDGSHVLRATVFNDEQAYLDYAASKGEPTTPHGSNVKARIDPAVPMGHLRVADGDELWFGLAMYLPEDYVFDSKGWGTESIGELQYREDLPPGTNAKGGAFSLSIGNGKLFIGTTYSSTFNPQDAIPEDKTDVTYDLELGMWYSIVCHVRFDHSDLATGFAEVWINGEKVMNEHGIRIGYRGMLDAKMALDIMTNYKHNWFLDPSNVGYSSITPDQQLIRSIYYDSLRVAKVGEGSFGMVDPLQAAGPVEGAPSSPTGPKAVGGEGTVAVTWNMSPHATNYTVKRSSTSGGPYATVGKEVAACSFVDNTVTSGGMYYYVVSANNLLGESAASSEVSAIPDVDPNVGMPLFSPVGGVYSEVQVVSLSSSTVEASIRYTTDGSEPNSSYGSLYSGPIDIDSTTTLKVIAYKAGMIDSSVATETYLIQDTPPPPLSVFYDDFESYSQGTLPRSDGAPYLWAATGDMLSLVEADVENRFNRGTSNQVLHLEDTGPGNQGMGTNVFPIGTTGQIAFDFNLPAGFNSATGGHPGILLRIGGGAYSGSFANASTRFSLGFHASGVLKTADNANSVLFGEILGSFAFDVTQRLTLAFNNTSSPVPYLDGSGIIAPDSIDVWLDDALLGTVGASNSSGGLAITTLHFLNRVGADTGEGYFDNVSFSSALTGGGGAAAPQAAQPEFNPVGGTFTTAQSVSITSATSAAVIRYTLDGSTPSETVGTIYTAPVAIDASATIKAIAYGSGLTASGVASADFEIAVPPLIVAQPASVTVDEGRTAQFGVEASGQQPLSYQWYENGEAMEGETASTVTIVQALLSSHLHEYYVVVSNDLGPVISDVAVLSVNKVPPTVDEYGWSFVAPSGDSLVVYVSSSEGDDANDGLSPETAKRTIEAGNDLIRDGYPDHLLLKRGDEFEPSSGTNLGSWKNGRSSEEPLVFSYYGESGPRPVVKVTDTLVDHDGRVRDYQNFIGLDIYKSNSDAASPDFDGSESLESLRFVGGGEGIRVEDCRLRFCGVDVESLGGSFYTNFEFRRNIILDTWNYDTSDSDSRIQGIALSNLREGYLIEENFFDHNGWSEEIETAGANQFSHNVYIHNSNVEGGIVRGNVIARGAAHGVLAESGGLVDRNLFILNAVALNLGGMAPDLPEVLAFPNRATENVALNGRLMDPTNTDYPRTAAVWGIAASDTLPGTYVAENITANRLDDGTNYAFRGLETSTFVNNISYAWDAGLDTFDPTWAHPDVDAGDYFASLGGTNSTEDYLDWLRGRPVGTMPWNMTSYAAINYIREGFGKAPVEGYFVYDVEEEAVPGDLDGNGSVGMEDLLIMRGALRKEAGQPGFLTEADLDDDGVISLYDYRILYGLISQN